MAAKSLRLIRDGLVDDPAMDTAVSEVLLRRAAAGIDPATLRVYRPGRVVAFGRRDVVHPGYPDAVAAARSNGFEAVERLAGGRAAVFHEGTIAIAWASPRAEPRRGIDERFDFIAGLVVAALAELGVDARIGQVPGEYCPGRHSVNARGATKLFGVGQRIVSKAVHVGGVLVVDGGTVVNDVLGPVYEALSFEWDPDATGDLRRERPDVIYEEAEDALLSQFEEQFSLAEGRLSPEVVEQAERRVEALRSPL